MSCLYPCSAPGCPNLFNRKGRETRCTQHGKPYAGGISHSFPKAVRDAILQRDGHRCRCPGCSYCDTNPHTKQLEADHIIPWSRGGTHTMDNGRTLCKPCHQRHTGAQFGWGGTHRGG